MKIQVETPFCEGNIKVERSYLGGEVRHTVIVDLKMPVKRVAKFSSHKQAREAVLEFASYLEAGPYPDECELRRVSQLLEEHLGIVPDDLEE